MDGFCQNVYFDRFSPARETAPELSGRTKS